MTRRLSSRDKDAEKLLPAAHGLLDVALQAPAARRRPSRRRPGNPRRRSTGRCAAPGPPEPAPRRCLGRPAHPRRAQARFRPPPRPADSTASSRRRPPPAPSATQRSRDQVVMGCPARIGDTRHFNWANGGDEVIERRAVGTDDVNPRRCPARPGSHGRRAQRFPWRRVRSGAPVRAGGRRTPRESARTAAALGSGPPVSARNAATRNEADDHPNHCLPAEHKHIAVRRRPSYGELLGSRCYRVNATTGERLGNNGGETQRHDPRRDGRRFLAPAREARRKSRCSPAGSCWRTERALSSHWVGA